VEVCVAMPLKDVVKDSIINRSSIGVSVVSSKNGINFLLTITLAASTSCQVAGRIPEKDF
jgi:hypothetical protein